MARPIYVGGISGGDTGSSYSISLTALTGGVASAPIEGDLVIVATGWTQTSDGTPGVTSPTGFTELVELYSNDTGDANLSVSYKFMEMTPDLSITVLGPNSAAYGGSTVVHVWRGVDRTTPMDVTHTTATGTNASRPDPPSITPATADAIIIAAGLGTGGTGQSAFTIPSGMTNAVSYKHDGTTGDCSAFLCSYNSWVSGSYDPAAATGGTTTTQDSWVAATLVLRPALAPPERTGSIIEIRSNSESLSQSITIPADTTLLLICITGAVIENATYLTPSVSVGGAAATFLQWNGHIDQYSEVVFYLENPPTGTQTYTITDIATIPLSPGLFHLIGCYKNVGFPNPIIGSASVKADSTQVAAQTAVIGRSRDLAVLFGSGVSTTALSLTNFGFTEVYNSGSAYNTILAAVAEKTVAAEITHMEVFGDYPAASGIVLRQSGAVTLTLVSTIANTSTTSSISVLSTANLTASIVGTSVTSTFPAVSVLNCTAAVNSISNTSTVDVGYLWNKVAAIASVSVTSAVSAELVILGDTLYFSADINSTSLCPGGLPILDDQGNVITDDTGDVIYDFDTVFITATSGLVANISTSSVTSEVSYSLNNKLFVSIVGVSVVPTIDSAVERPLTSIVSATSSASSPDATVVEGTYKYIAASIVAECLVPGGLPILDSNGEPILDDTGYVIYDFDTIFVTVDRSLTASISNISNTSTPEILSVQVRNLIAAVSSVSVSSDIGFSQIGRNLQAAAQAISVTSTLSNTLERNIVAGLQGISAVPDTVIEIVRSLIVSIGSLSASSDASIEFLRDLVVSINATSSARDISATVSGEVVLLADIHGDSTTSAADSTRQIDLLAVIGSSSSTSSDSEASIGEVRILVASIDLSSSTSVVATFVGRDLLSWVAAISVLGDAQLNADRKILAIINGTSITYDDVNLLLEGLGQIHNPRIYSATVRRGIVSRTTKRSIRSF